MSASPPRLSELTREQSLRLLGGLPFGRIVFTQHALPTIRPVNHLVDRNEVMVRTHPGAAIVAAGQTAGVVVAYEADEISVATRAGWTVIVTGTARVVQDARDAARYASVLQPWVAGDMSQLIRISADIVTGYSLGQAMPGADQAVTRAE
jgi:hypothetical protein